MESLKSCKFFIVFALVLLSTGTEVIKGQGPGRVCNVYPSLPGKCTYDLCSNECRKIGPGAAGNCDNDQTCHCIYIC
ncbi:hypothetical protein K1719_034844 [Acacia pycnantha]|nr:hypothetical protein K1719_034844 [Acacia pycnantha]